MSKKRNIFQRGYNPESSEQVTETSEITLPEIVLDSQQQEIVNSIAKNIIVVAGAGSGKTRVLTERVKHLLDIGVMPHNIVAITFTNLAAEEMRTRLKHLDGIGDAFIGTIHSFANRLMKESGKEYQLFNDEISLKYHTYLIEKYCKFLKLRRWMEYCDLKANVDVGKASEYQLNTLLDEKERLELMMIERTQKDMIQGNFTSISYPEYIQSLCARDNVITFNQLLEMANDYFNSLGARVEHVLVDELQDVGTLEYSFVQGLKAENYFYVGDDWQSIYGFKGGNVNIFLNLVRNPEYTVYYLTTNYRNSTEVLKTAETVINQVENKIPKDIIPHRAESEGKVTISNTSKLRSFLLEIKEDKSFKDWFILTRSNKELYEMLSQCNHLGIPSTTFKREGMTLADLQKKMKSNKVKILTVHASKGLESKNVLLYGSFPLHCPPYRINSDERKVMYVGITRAEDRLIILN